MRISDWSSDVCSSDLPTQRRRERTCHGNPRPAAWRRLERDRWLLPEHLSSERGKPPSVSWQQHRRLEHRFEERLERLWPCGLEAGRPHRVRCQGPLRRISRQCAQLQCRASARSEEHKSELQSLMRISYAVFCLKKKTNQKPLITTVSYSKDT